MTVFVVVKEFIEGLEEFLLVCVIKFHEERGIVRFSFLPHKACANFVLAVKGWFVTLLLISPTKGSRCNVFLVHPTRVVTSFGSSVLRRSKLIKGLGNGCVEIGKIVFEGGGRVGFQGV